MTLSAIIDDIVAQRKQVVVYTGTDDGADLAEMLATRNLVVDRRRIPNIGADSFVVIRDSEQFRGAISLVDLLAFLAPPIRRPARLGSVDDGYRAIYDLLDDTVFVSMDRRQLLATSREMEDRAWRTGRGRFHAGFQSPSLFAPQATIYRELATVTDIDVHVYADGAIPDDQIGDAPITTHVGASDGIGRYWFILFEDGGDGSQNCALIAEQNDADTYRGVWTYNQSLVERAFEAVG